MLSVFVQSEGHSGLSSGSASPISSIPTSPGIYGVSVSPPGPQVAAHPLLKGDDDTEEKIMTCSDAYAGGADVNELIQQLKEAESLHEQADIIHYLFTSKYAHIVPPQSLLSRT